MNLEERERREIIREGDKMKTNKNECKNRVTILA